MTPTTSVVIPMHNAADVIRQQLDGLLVALPTEPDTEIIVVDNRSTDAGTAVVTSWASETGAPVRVVPAHDKPGEPHARNIGWQTARSDVILYCDADDVVSPAWLTALASAVRQHPYVTGPLDTFLLNDPSIANLRGQALFQSLPTLKNGIPFAHGCNMGYQRSALERLGGFDESFLIACDIEIAVRASFLNIPLAWIPDALVHYRLRSDVKGVYKQARAYGRSRRRIDEILDHTSAVDWSQQVRRAAWLLRHAPEARSYGGRMKWAWVAGQLTGELGGRLRWTQ